MFVFIKGLIGAHPRENGQATPATFRPVATAAASEMSRPLAPCAMTKHRCDSESEPAGASLAELEDREKPRAD